MKPRFLPLLLAAYFSAALFTQADTDIGFIEKFALAADREQVLSQLVPGSEEYYFFHALHFQNTRQAAKLKAVMDQWAARFPNSGERRINRPSRTSSSYSYCAQPLQLLQNGTLSHCPVS